MKKRHILFLIISVLIISLVTIPAFIQRVSFEQSQKGYNISLNVNLVFDNHKTSEIENVILSYINSGVNNLLLSENKDNTFNIDYLEFLKDKKADLSLEIFLNEEKPKDYIENLDKIIKDYDIKFLVLNSSKKNKDIYLPIEKIIKENNLTIVLSETESQLSNKKVIGLENYLESASYKVQRAFRTKENPSYGIKDTKNVNSSKIVFMQMMNSLRERNTRFLIVNELKDENVTPNISSINTQKAISDFSAYIKKLGYEKGEINDLSSYKINQKIVLSFSMILMSIFVIFILNILFRMKKAYIEYLIILFGMFLALSVFFIPQKVIMLYPAVISIMSAFTLVSVCVYIIDKFKGIKNTFLYFVCSLFTTLFAIVFSGMIVSSVLASPNYYLNIDIYKMVKISLVMPIVYAPLFMMFFVNRYKKFLSFKSIKECIENLIKNIRIYHIVVIILIMIFGFIYLMRSGNSKISYAEYNIRAFLSKVTTARPRTKEMLVGWPFLALFIYYMKNSSSKLVKIIYAFFSSVLFASCINTFCHVFTDVKVSILRTLYGFLFGLIFIIIALIINKFILCIISKIKRDKIR